MKNKKLVVYALTASLLLSTPSIALANTEYTQMSSKQEIVFTEQTGKAFIDENNRTMVPIRVIMEALDCDVSWNNDTKVASVLKDENVVDVPINQNYITVNGVKEENDTKAVIINNRTYLPIRKVVEGLNGIVNWDNSTNSVNISMDSKDYTFKVEKQKSKEQIKKEAQAIIYNIENCINETNALRSGWKSNYNTKFCEDSVAAYLNELTKRVDGISRMEQLSTEISWYYEQYKDTIEAIKEDCNKIKLGLFAFNEIVYLKNGKDGLLSTKQISQKLNNEKRKMGTYQNDNDLAKLKLLQGEAENILKLNKECNQALEISWTDFNVSDEIKVYILK